jgi:formylglycine-generating enzyme required for sulfatase activity
VKRNAIAMSAVKWFLIALVATEALSFKENISFSPGWAVETVDVPPRAFNYRLAGEFSLAGLPVDAPIVRINRVYPLRIMKRQVTAAEYDRCVAAGGCKPSSPDREPNSDFPAVNVSWDDATAYAHWISKQTGSSWRLPTDEEWAFAAGARFHDDALAVAATSDPSIRWLARYEREAGASPGDRRLHRIGGFGANEYGLLDLSGNVWEWTNTCFIRQPLNRNGNPIGATTVNCGVRVAEGAHRAYVTDFIRDASNGGCAAGKPPSNLGFRLVREDRIGLLASLFGKSWPGP